MVFSKEQMAKVMDYTLLKPTATRDDVVRYCEQAKQYHFATVVVFPFWIPVAARELAGSDVKTATVIGFPYGTNGRAVKLYEARAAVTNGAQELDVVMNISALKSGEISIVEREIKELVDTTRALGMTEDAKRMLIKIIIETYYLTDQEKRIACQIIADAGADFIKTSTGTAPGGATIEDIRLIRDVVGREIGVKAAGGIRTPAQAVAMLDAGANRIGTSAAVEIFEAYHPEDFMQATERRRRQ
ncbi:MAG TPA: deoxyribose-phosphate aldolase [Armatimonadota bacterium]|nr:deoxyribose-phosphate aldolase [Armatimonadota bacterium]